MSLFGYPATVTHHQANMDNWGQVMGYGSVIRKAKVVDRQKIIKNGKGEEVLSMAEVHLEGYPLVTLHDYFEYNTGLGQMMRFDVLHVEPRKFLGTDQVKKVIVYA